MKKLLSLGLLTVLVLSGCGQQIDYQDPQSYIDYAQNAVGSVNSDLQGNISDLKSNLNIDNSKVIDQTEKYFDKILNKLSPEQAEDLYNAYTSKVDDLVDENTDQINKINDKVNDYISKTSDYSQKQIDKTMDNIDKYTGNLDDTGKTFEKKLKDFSNETPDNLKASLNNSFN